MNRGRPSDAASECGDAPRFNEAPIHESGKGEPPASRTTSSAALQ